MFWSKIRHLTPMWSNHVNESKSVAAALAPDAAGNWFPRSGGRRLPSLAHEHAGRDHGHDSQRGCRWHRCFVIFWATFGNRLYLSSRDRSRYQNHSDSLRKLERATDGLLNGQGISRCTMRRRLLAGCGDVPLRLRSLTVLYVFHNA